MTQSPSSISPEQLLAHADWVRALARALVADPAGADDLVQETWLAALDRPPAHAQDLRAWLGTVLRNLARRSAPSPV